MLLAKCDDTVNNRELVGLIFMRSYFGMPYAYLTESNLADDFWTIRLFEN